MNKLNNQLFSIFLSLILLCSAAPAFGMLIKINPLALVTGASVGFTITDELKKVTWHHSDTARMYSPNEILFNGHATGPNGQSYIAPFIAGRCLEMCADKLTVDNSENKPLYTHRMALGLGAIGGFSYLGNYVENFKTSNPIVFAGTFYGTHYLYSNLREYLARKYLASKIINSTTINIATLLGAGAFAAYNMPKSGTEATILLGLAGSASANLIKTGTIAAMTRFNKSISVPAKKTAGGTRTDDRIRE